MTKQNRHRLLVGVLCVILAFPLLLPMSSQAVIGNTAESSLSPIALHTNPAPTVPNGTAPPREEYNPYAEEPQGHHNLGVVAIFFEGAKLNMNSPARLIDDTTFVPLAELSAILASQEAFYPTEIYSNFSEDYTLTLQLYGLIITARVDDPYLVANGRYLFVPSLIRLIDEEVFVPLRPLALAWGMDVSWCNDTRSINLYHEHEFILCGSLFYDEEELYWMARIIRIESHNETFIGKVAVGNVVMNRTVSHHFPDTVYEVIFDRRHGVQFPPAFTNAMTAIEPCARCYIAAKLALDGASVVEDALYFNRRGLNSWASRNRPYIMSIGNHSFFG